jgi:hypothetical protein
MDTSAGDLNFLIQFFFLFSVRYYLKIINSFSER